MSLFHLEALAISATLFLQRYRTNCQGDRAPSCRHSSAAVIWAFQSRYSLPFCKLYFLYRSFLVFRWIASGSFLFILYCKQSHSWSHRRSKGLKQPLRTWFVLFSEILFYIRSVRISNLKIPKYRGSGSAVVSNEWTKGLLEDLEGQVRIDNFEFLRFRFHSSLWRQVTAALSRKDWFQKWGVHYLPSLARAHILQQVRTTQNSILNSLNVHIYSATISRIPVFSSMAATFSGSFPCTDGFKFCLPNFCLQSFARSGWRHLLQAAAADSINSTTIIWLFLVGN